MSRSCIRALPAAAIVFWAAIVNAVFGCLGSRRVHWCLLLALLLCHPLSRILPPAWAWENGVVENAQVLVLLAGSVLAWQAARAQLTKALTKAASTLARCAIPVWLLLAGRELSWGAVFLAPLGFGPGGPVYTSRVLWYRPMVVPVAAAILAGIVYWSWRHRLDRSIKEVCVRRRFPWLPLGVMAAAACASTFAEGHLDVFEGFSPKQGEGFEELTELVGYLALLSLQAGIIGNIAGTARTAQPGAAPKPAPTQPADRIR